ncbi:hypothetical protein ACQ86G_26920 [Roseateles chitinivorans]|uniref:hypothetical protein n=1 Tax=Roseateles chitinivorans TaxID=2917965 RepID=UPI003D67A577
MKLRVFACRWPSILMLAGLTAGTAAAAPGDVVAGMICTVPDGWWSLDRERPQQPEPVKVLVVKPLTTGVPGAWVQPQRGKLSDQQLQLALERLTDCR